MKKVKTIIQMCSYCGETRHENGEWIKASPRQLENSTMNVSHGICPSCVKKHFPQQYQAIIDRSLPQ